MKKIRLLVVGALLVGLYTLLGSTAFALLSPEAGLSQFTFQTAVLDILVGENSGGPFTNEFSMNTTEMLLADGSEHIQDFWVKNASSNGVSYALQGQLGAGDQDWEILKQAIEVKVSNLTEDTGWFTLADWESQARFFPGTLAASATQRYQFIYRLPEFYAVDPDGTGPLMIGDPIGEELEGKVTTGMIFTISGDVL